MKADYQLHFVDVFTTTPGLGNRAGVVLDASELSAAQMQAIAAEAQASETAFGVPSSRPADYDLEVRYFSRTREVPLCGHATIGFHYLRARMLDLSSRTVRVKTGAGILPVEIDRVDHDHRIVMTQGAPRIVTTATVQQRLAVCRALGLSEGELVSELPIQVVTTGHAKVLVPIRSHRALSALRQERERLIELGTVLGASGFFVFTLDRQRPDVLYHGRMFAPGTGVDEDPVTGNANGPAGYYLFTHGLLRPAPSGIVQYQAIQGEAMGKPGLIEVLLYCRGDVVERVQVTGKAVLVNREAVIGQV